jgi:uncharacterized protein YjbI with pentapeptide repeats
VGRKKDGFKQEPSSKKSPWWKRLWGWTGFGEKKLWDWLELLSSLAIPVVLAVAGFWFTAQQEQRQQRIEDQRAQQAQKIENQRADSARQLEEQRAQDAALQAYLDQMNTLLLEHDLRNSEEDSEVRTLARARTLTVLGRLDSGRKTQVMRFLLEADLIQRDVHVNPSGEVFVSKEGPVISLETANLQGVDLRLRYQGAALQVSTDLSGVNLSGANLSDANLSFSTLYGADLSDADLSNADLSEASLLEADLSWADLSDADLSYSVLIGADLSHADLSSADMEDADMEDADLTDADLSGANLREVVGINTRALGGDAYSLEGATMPDGTKHP